VRAGCAPARHYQTSGPARTTGRRQRKEQNHEEGPQDCVAELVDQFGGTYATEGQFTAEVSFLLGKLRAIREKEADHE
jgi:hypothetical protein